VEKRNALRTQWYALLETVFRALIDILKLYLWVRYRYQLLQQPDLELQDKLQQMKLLSASTGSNKIIYSTDDEQIAI
jgi:hypothetical protein